MSSRYYAEHYIKIKRLHSTILGSIYRCESRFVNTFSGIKDDDLARSSRVDTCNDIVVSPRMSVDVKPVINSVPRLHSHDAQVGTGVAIFSGNDDEEQKHQHDGSFVTNTGHHMLPGTKVVIKRSSLLSLEVARRGQGNVLCREDAERELMLYLDLQQRLHQEDVPFMQLLDHFRTERDIFMVFEAGECDLFTLTTTFGTRPENTLPSGIDMEQYVQIALMMVNSVNRLHLLGVAHLDVSLENFVINSNMQVKLIDLGLARQLDSSATYHFNCGNNDVYDSFRIGKSSYMSIRNTVGYAWNGYKQDVFSIGVCLFVMCFGVNPFASADLDDPAFVLATTGRIRRLIIEWGYNDWLKIDGISQLIDWIEVALLSSSRRISMSELVSIVSSTVK